MSEDVVVIEGQASRDSISALPETYLEALSAIQEQAFIEAGLDDPDYYAEAFTLKHRLSFFKVGLFAGLGDCVLTLIGMVLYVLGRMKAVPVFGYERSTCDYLLSFVIVTFPYSATLFLTIRTFAHISGTISRKMAFYLSLGFTEGAVMTTALIFALCYAIATDWKQLVYTYLWECEKVSPLLTGMSAYFWTYLRPALISGAWDDLKMGLLVSCLMLLSYVARVFWLRKEEKMSL